MLPMYFLLVVICYSIESNVHGFCDVNVSGLKTALNKELFGQHLAIDIVVTALKAHIEDKNPSKALVLSLHGWAGSGKTFTSQHLMNALYKSGMDSSFVRFFMSSYHFPDADKVQEYQVCFPIDVNSISNSQWHVAGAR